MRPALRHPPAFSLEVSLDPAWQILQAGLCSLAVTLLALSFVLHLDDDVSQPMQVVLCLTALILFIGFWFRLPQPSGRLAWDGQMWLWLDARAGAGPAAEATVVRITMAIDWGDWCLLRLQHSAQAQGWRFALLPRRRYIALAQRRHAATWSLLRACLVASGS